MSESVFLRVLPQTVPFKCLNRGHKISNYTQYMLEATIKHNEKLKFYPFMRLIALNNAITEADITSVSIPAPQVIVPSGAVTPM